MNELIYKNSIYGRTFLLLDNEQVKLWRGYSEGESSQYDLLEDHIDYDDAGFSTFQFENAEAGILFSMSTKFEVFKTSNGWVLYDGLYFDSSLKDALMTKTEIIEEKVLSGSRQGGCLFLIDATLNSTNIDLNCPFGLAETKDFLKIELNSEFQVDKVQSHFKQNNETGLLTGISITSKKDEAFT